MQRVLVVDEKKRPLMPCHPARARNLLKKGKAVVFRHYPFVIMLKSHKKRKIQPVQFKVDPGSRYSGLVLVGNFQKGCRVIWAAEIEHRSWVIYKRLKLRKDVKRKRRWRKTRYRPCRCLNRKRKKGVLYPSIQSRLENILTYFRRISCFTPISSITQEVAKFDIQALMRPGISGIDYCQGPMFGMNLQEALTQKYGRHCQNCGKKRGRLEKDHVIPKSRGGSDKVWNRMFLCEACNKEKGKNILPDQKSKTFSHMHAMGVINMIRWRLFECFKGTGLTVEGGVGQRTAQNRKKQHYPKTHWIDAACAGKSGERVFLNPELVPLKIKATGHGHRQMCLVDRFGFPRSGPRQHKRVKGFQTGDVVFAIHKHKKVTGPITIRKSGYFKLGKINSVSYARCRRLHRADGYLYIT